MFLFEKRNGFLKLKFFAGNKIEGDHLRRSIDSGRTMNIDFLVSFLENILHDPYSIFSMSYEIFVVHILDRTTLEIYVVFLAKNL